MNEFTFFVEKNISKIIELHILDPFNILRAFYEKDLINGILNWDRLAYFAITVLIIGGIIRGSNVFLILKNSIYSNKISYRLDLWWTAFGLLKLQSFFSKGFSFLLPSFLFNNLNIKVPSNYSLTNHLLTNFDQITVNIIIFLILFLLFDFLNYYLHYLQHKIKALWFFHRIHHYPQQLTIFATVRTHPVDAYLSNIPYLIVGLVSFALGYQQTVASTSPFDLTQFEGLKYFAGLTTLSTVFGLFSHSTFKVNYGKYLGAILYSPMDHVAHHSALLETKNCGSFLIIWDKLFGTYFNINDNFEIHAENLGTTEELDDYYDNIGQAIFYPFKDLYDYLISLLFSKHTNVIAYPN